MRRVILIKQQYSPTGGAERFVERAIDALAQSPLRVTLISRRWDANPGLEVIPCRPFYLGRTWRDGSFSRCVRHQLPQFTGALIQSHERIPGCQIYRAGDGVHREWLAQRVRTLGRLQRWTEIFNLYHRSVLRAEQKMYADTALQAVICNSNMVRDELRHHYNVPTSKLHTIYNSVDSERFSPATRLTLRESARRRWVIREDVVVVAFIGSGYARKGLATALRAIALAGHHFQGIVAGKDRHTHGYTRLARQLGIAHRIQFLGPVENVDQVYAAADIVILPTLYDPFANVVLEGMACGLPVITSTKCGAVDIIEHGKNGYIRDALDHDGIAADLRQLADTQVRTQIGLAARTTVLPFTDSLMIDKLTTLYQTLLTDQQKN